MTPKPHDESSYFVAFQYYDLYNGRWQPGNTVVNLTMLPKTIDDLRQLEKFLSQGIFTGAPGMPKITNPPYPPEVTVTNILCTYDGPIEIAIGATPTSPHPHPPTSPLPQLPPDQPTQAQVTTLPKGQYEHNFFYNVATPAFTPKQPKDRANTSSDQPSPPPPPPPPKR